MFNVFSKSKPTPTSIKTLEFEISGMHCVSCAMNIDGALEDCLGVISADTNYARSITKIEFDETKVDLKTLQEIIKTEGYTLIL